MTALERHKKMQHLRTTLNVLGVHVYAADIGVTDERIELTIRSDGADLAYIVCQEFGYTDIGIATMRLDEL